MKKRNDGGETLTNEDLLTQVLTRLPVLNLLRCKAVCKCWYSLISTPSFIKAHYQRAFNYNNEAAATLILRRYKNEDRIEYPQEDGSYSLVQLGDSNNFIAHLDFPFSKGDYPVDPPSLVIGCVYGVVCVCVDVSASIDANHCWITPDKAFDIYIWNPATRQSKLIAQHTVCDCDCDGTNEVALGFGFDPIDFDFKVVRVVTRVPEVYSANRDAWRNIEAELTDVPRKNYPLGNRFDICLHGFLFVLGLNGMLAFDLNKEVFICDIKIPVSPHECFHSRIADFKDSVALIISKERSEKINLWTLDDEACFRGGRVEASWTLMLSIDLGVQLVYLQCLFNSVEFLLVADYWFYYNSDKKVGRYLYTFPFFDFDEVYEYSESLLSVAGSKPVNWSDDQNVGDQSSVDSEDDYEEFILDSEGDNEECTEDSEGNEQSNIISQDDNDENNVEPYEEFILDSEDDDEECTEDSEGNEKSNIISQDDNDENNVEP